MYSLIYDCFIYVQAFENPESTACDILIDNFAMNEILWFVTRSNTNYIWVIPVLIVFWPRIIKAQRDNVTTDGKLS